MTPSFYCSGLTIISKRQLLDAVFPFSGTVTPWAQGIAMRKVESETRR